MKPYVGVDVQTNVFLTSALVGAEWLTSRPGRFTHAEIRPGNHCTGSWVGPRASLDNIKKGKFLTLPGLELQPLDHPARMQPLYDCTIPVL
jgi:hypothetical protein